LFTAYGQHRFVPHTSIIVDEAKYCALYTTSIGTNNNNNNNNIIIVTNIFYELEPCALLRDTLQNDIIILFSWISRVSQFHVFFFLSAQTFARVSFVKLAPALPDNENIIRNYLHWETWGILTASLWPFARRLLSI